MRSLYSGSRKSNIESCETSLFLLAGDADMLRLHRFERAYMWLGVLGDPGSTPREDGDWGPWGYCCVCACVLPTLARNSENPSMELLARRLTGALFGRPSGFEPETLDFLRRCRVWVPPNAFLILTKRVGSGGGGGGGCGGLLSDTRLVVPDDPLEILPVKICDVPGVDKFKPVRARLILRPDVGGGGVLESWRVGGGTLDLLQR